MGPEVALIIVFVIAAIAFKVATGSYKLALSARLAMSVMLVIIGAGHFLFTNGIMMMLPDFIPLKRVIIYLTGIFEIVAAIGLHIPRYRKKTAWLLIVYVLIILPTNIYAATIHLNEQTGKLDGDGPEILWYRVPLQLVFIAWLYFSSIRKSSE